MVDYVLVKSLSDSIDFHQSRAIELEKHAFHGYGHRLSSQGLWAPSDDLWFRGKESELLKRALLDMAKCHLDQAELMRIELSKQVGAPVHVGTRVTPSQRRNSFFWRYFYWLIYFLPRWHYWKKRS